MVNINKINEASKRLEKVSGADNQRTNQIVKDVIKVLKKHQVTVQEVGVVLGRVSQTLNEKVNNFTINKIQNE